MISRKKGREGESEEERVRESGKEAISALNCRSPFSMY